MKKVLFLVVSAVIGTMPCLAGNGLDKPTQKMRVGFSVLERLQPGSSTKSDLTRLLGKPNKVTDLKDVPGSSLRGERWEYSEDGLDRFTVFVARETDKISSYVFDVDEGDPEKALKVAMSRYPEANWQPDTVKWINPHHFPDECFLKDEARGIRIEYQVERQTVNSIFRWDPSRKLAAAPADEKPPEYCIGGGCSPAMAATEFFKQWPIEEYCKVPKK